VDKFIGLTKEEAKAIFLVGFLGYIILFL